MLIPYFKCLLYHVFFVYILANVTQNLTVMLSVKYTMFKLSFLGSKCGDNNNLKIKNVLNTEEINNSLLSVDYLELTVLQCYILVFFQ